MDIREGEVFVTKEDLTEKHRKEKKELQAKIQALKKTATKGDKKKKKEVADMIASMEKELNDRHASEAGTLDTSVKSNESGSTEEVENELEPKDMACGALESKESGNKVSRAQKRRMKKQVLEKEREKRIAEEEAFNQSGPRTLESNALKEALRKEGLQIHEVPADGNCLYCAINHQLNITGQTSYSVSKLRKMTSNFIQENKDDFLPFMHNDDDNDDEVIDDEQFERYCKDVASTKLWGGQLELAALSKILRCPIRVVQATGTPHLQGESFENPSLVLTYHKHLYRLGEHYNSTVKLSQDENEERDT